MLVLKLELWPLGNEQSSKEIGRVYIANNAKTTQKDPRYGSYTVAVCRKGTTENPLRGKVKATRTGTVENFPRLSLNVWRLVLRALRSSFPEEK